MSNQILIKEKFYSFETGYRELLNGNILCLIKIDRNFSLEITESVFNKNLPEKFNSQMHIFVDSNKNNQNIFTIQNEIVNSIKNVFLKYLNLFGTYDQSSFPIVFEKYSSDQANLTDYMAPGIALSVIFFLSVASTASNYVLERQLGLIERSYLAGGKIIELLLSQLIIYSALMVIQIGIVLVLLFLFLEIQLKAGSIPILVSLIFLQGFCGLCYGLCLAALFYDQETVLQLTIGSFYPILLMSGIIWPIEAQPFWLSKYVSNLLPLTYATEAFR